MVMIGLQVIMNTIIVEVRQDTHQITESSFLRKPLFASLVVKSFLLILSFALIVANNYM